MERHKIQKIVDEIDKYNIRRNRIPPYVAIYGEDAKNPKRKITKYLNFSSNKSNEEFIKVLNSFSENIKKYIHGDVTLINLENDNDGNNFIYKKIDEQDMEKIGEFTKSSDTKVKLTDFLDYNKFVNVFFIVEINLDESVKKKILLFKSISSNYKAKQNKYSSKLFKDSVEINFINVKNDLILDANFEITAFIDTSNDDNLINSFFFIQNRTKFENLYKYHERYENAYSALTEKMDFIEWSLVESSIPLKRLCYNIANFDSLETCIENLIINLTAHENNDIKRAFSSKKIKYEIDEKGNLKIIPENKQQLKSLLKIIKDNLAKTCLLGRNVLGANFEEIE